MQMAHDTVTHSFPQMLVACLLERLAHGFFVGKASARTLGQGNGQVMLE